MNTISYFQAITRVLLTVSIKGLLIASLAWVISCEDAGEALVTNIPETYVLRDQLELAPLEGKWYLGEHPFSGYAVRCDATGNMVEQVGFLHGKKNGKAQFWYPDGSLMKTASYRDNKLHGEMIGYYPNGNLRSEGMYVEGTPEGIHIKWYEDGQMARKRTLEKGQESGLQQAWNPNGSLYANYQAKDGRIFGLKRNNSCYALQNEKVQFE